MPRSLKPYEKIISTISRLEEDEKIEVISVKLCTGEIAEFFTSPAPTHRWIQSITYEGELKNFHYVGNDGSRQNFLCREDGRIYGKSGNIFSAYPFESTQTHYKELYKEAIQQITT